ncbi:MAG: germination protein YpeB [Clostridia bacterium]|nr:germination protein YpeB [Clostridia bacterium]
MKRKYGYWLLTAALIAVSCFAGYEYYRANTLERSVSNSYNRAFFELNDYVDDINSLLAKGLLVNSPQHFAAVSAELSRQSAAAKECLSQLPLSEIEFDKTEKFLSQVGDYSFYLSRNALYDNKMTDEEYQTLSTLGKYAENLSAALNSLQEDIYSGSLTLYDGGYKSANVAYAENGNDGFSAIEKEFGEYPSLIYDGPFSEHIGDRAPALLEGKEVITAERAAEIANQFFGRQSGFISYSGKSENAAINAYTFTADENRRVVSVTEQGGYILYYMNSRDVGEHTLDVNEAIAKAQEFLTAQGYTSMTESYYENTNGRATINFAYTENGVVHYSDLVKVTVALDNGEVIGLETHGYIMNHAPRTNLTPRLTRQDARGYVSQHLSIDSAQLALIPKDSEREVLCYEFKGTSNGKNFLVYINAENGREEEIMLLVESETGILTV